MKLTCESCEHCETDWKNGKEILYCTYYPDWKIVDDEHYCGQHNKR